MQYGKACRNTPRHRQKTSNDSKPQCVFSTCVSVNTFPYLKVAVIYIAIQKRELELALHIGSLLPSPNNNKKGYSLFFHLAILILFSRN